MFISDFLCQCGVLFLIAFIQRGIWFLRLWVQSRKRDSARAAHNNDKTNKPTDGNQRQEFELNNTTSHKNNSNQHPQKSRPQDTPKEYVQSVLLEKKLLQRNIILSHEPFLLIVIYMHFTHIEIHSFFSIYFQRAVLFLFFNHLVITVVHS